MTGADFRSDNVAPVADEIMAAIAAVNFGPAPAYGADEVTARLEATIGELFEHAVRVHPVASGTAANCLALASLVAPGGTILCHEDAHIRVAEEGAPAVFVPDVDCAAIAGPVGHRARRPGPCPRSPAGAGQRRAQPDPGDGMGHGLRPRPHRRAGRGRA